MENEINATIELWAKSLYIPIQDNGDAMGSRLAMMLKAHTPQPNTEQLQKFKDYLSSALRRLILENAADWKKDNPKFGSHWRSLSVDYDPCPELRAACIWADIDTALLPIKSWTETNPGIVNYRFGYTDKLHTIPVE